MLKRTIWVFSTVLALSLLLGAQAKAETYKLFVNLPLSGPWSSFGEGMFNSFKLAIDQGNASGVMGKVKLKVVRGDNAGDSAQAASLATKAPIPKSSVPSAAGAAAWRSPPTPSTTAMEFPPSSAGPTTTARRGRRFQSHRCLLLLEQRPGARHPLPLQPLWSSHHPRRVQRPPLDAAVPQERGHFPELALRPHQHEDAGDLRHQLRQAEAHFHDRR